MLDIREPDWFEHRMFKGPDTDINLHVLSSGCPEIDDMLKFRRRLRGHPSDRDLYARIKLALAQREWEFCSILRRCQRRDCGDPGTLPA
jgi:GrpB-like predicted nucleotidyltransferase (UPF0157 family)